jgi:hypothetical protein
LYEFPLLATCSESHIREDVATTRYDGFLEVAVVAPIILRSWKKEGGGLGRTVGRQDALKINRKQSARNRVRWYNLIQNMARSLQINGVSLTPKSSQSGTTLLSRCRNMKSAAKPLSLGIFMCTILPCIGLQVMDDGMAMEAGGVSRRSPKMSATSEFIGPYEEYQVHSSQGAHIAAEQVQQRQQARLEHIAWQANVRKHVESTGAAYVGHIPDHVLEHLAEL